MFDTPQSKFMDGNTSEYIALGNERWYNWYNGSAAFNTGCSWWDSSSDTGVAKEQGPAQPSPEFPEPDSTPSADSADSGDSEQSANIAKAKKSKKERKTDGETNPNWDDGVDVGASDSDSESDDDKSAYMTKKQGLIGRSTDDDDDDASSSNATSAEDVSSVSSSSGPDADTAMGRGESGRLNHKDSHPTETSDKPQGYAHNLDHIHKDRLPSRPSLAL